MLRLLALALGQVLARGTRKRLRASSCNGAKAWQWALCVESGIEILLFHVALLQQQYGFGRSTYCCCYCRCTGRSTLLNYGAARRQPCRQG